MPNVVPFPTQKARPPQADTGASVPDGISLQDKSWGEVLLFTGIRYMRRPPQQADAGTPGKPPAGEEKQG